MSNGPVPTQEQNNDGLSQDKKSVLSPKSVAAPHQPNEQTFAPESTLAISDGYVTEVPPQTMPLKGQEEPSRMPTLPLGNADLNLGVTSPDDTVLQSRARGSSMKIPSSSMTH